MSSRLVLRLTGLHNAADRSSVLAARGPVGTQGVRHVYARVTTVDGDPGRNDEVITFVKSTVQPLLEQLPGSLGTGERLPASS